MRFFSFSSCLQTKELNCTVMTVDITCDVDALFISDGVRSNFLVLHLGFVELPLLSVFEDWKIN